VAYDSLTTLMDSGALNISYNLTGLTNGSSTTYYIGAQSTDALDGVHPTLTNTPLTVTVLGAPAADITAPSTVTNLDATALSQSQAQLTWTVATDNVAVRGYIVYQATGACSTYTTAQELVLTTTTLVSLAPNVVHCFKVRAIDTSNNLSAADSNIATITTSDILDIERPTSITNLRLAMAAFTRSALLTWDQCTDNFSAPITSIEQCQGAGCTSFGLITSKISLDRLLVTLTPGTAYRFRAICSDAAGNVSAAYSNTLDVMTNTIGLPQPPTQYPPGQSRATAPTRTPYPGNRAQRP